ncbi:hypothetical protein SAMN05421780_105253 [Flexibacter flexilis DSM 6793]|uniref:Uncharacterized protein n=1 Tax=Flexibacter flexilis DSM 6793 TaxID=927664 RepID=A0A1I1JAU6_9BACT|nr:hypothetical protein SAMN05421780_105253 [Flexibacter flexilis DSM 6793]
MALIHFVFACFAAHALGNIRWVDVEKGVFGVAGGYQIQCADVFDTGLRKAFPDSFTEIFLFVAKAFGDGIAVSVEGESAPDTGTKTHGT